MGKINGLDRSLDNRYSKQNKYNKNYFDTYYRRLCLPDQENVSPRWIHASF